MKINTKLMGEARIAAGRTPCDATVCGLVMDEIPPGALVRFMDGSYAIFRAGWPKHCDQAVAHKAVEQSRAASNPRSVSVDRRAQLVSNLEKARAARAAKRKAAET